MKKKTLLERDEIFFDYAMIAIIDEPFYAMQNLWNDKQLSGKFVVHTYFFLCLFGGVVYYSPHWSRHYLTVDIVIGIFASFSRDPKSDIVCRTDRM